MVKTPKMRHSKSRREPVTIELEPGAVSRIVDADAAKADEVEAQAESVPAEEAVAVADAQPETPDEPIHADQADLEPWEHSDAAVQAAPESADATISGDPEKPYPAASDAQPRARTSDYSFEDASPKPGAPKETPDTAEVRNQPMAAQPKRSNGIAAGIIGGVIALAAAGGLQFAGVLGAPGSGGGTVSLDGVNGEIASLKREIADLREAGGNGVATAKVDGLSTALDQVKADVASLKSAVEQGGAGDNAGLAALGDKVKQIETAVAALSQAGNAAPVDLAPLNEKLSSLDALAKSAGEAATAQAGRLAALEQSVTQLSGKVDAQASQPKIAMAIAASALKAALDRGAPFAAELETFAAISVRVGTPFSA